MTLILQGTDNSVSSPAVQGGTAGTTTGVYYPSTNQIALATNGTLGLIQDANRNIGLGITPNSSWNTFSVIESGRSGNAFFGQTGASQVGLGTNAYYSSGWKYANTAVASLYYQLSGSHTFAGAASGTATNAVTFTTLLAFSRGNTLALEGASQQAGTGITFPATQSASSDANTLDDYEEGTFTPTLTSGFSTAPTSYTSQSGSYTRIGRLVFFQFDIDPNGAIGNASGITFGGLPFVSINTGNYSGAYVNYQINFDTNTLDSFHITSSSTTIVIYDQGGNGRTGNAAGVNINSRIILSGCYQTT